MNKTFTVSLITLFVSNLCSAQSGFLCEARYGENVINFDPSTEETYKMDYIPVFKDSKELASFPTIEFSMKTHQSYNSTSPLPVYEAEIKLNANEQLNCKQEAYAGLSDAAYISCNIGNKKLEITCGKADNE